MKKFLFLFVCSMVSGSVFAEGFAEFKKGEFIGNVGIGIGTHGAHGTGAATFTQKLSFEYALREINDKSTLSIGFMASNSYGGSGKTILLGTYDYSYTWTTQSHLRDYTARGRAYKDSYSSRQVHRSGVGTAEADVSYDDVKLMPTVSYHYQLMSSLDLYATLGIGVAIMNRLVSDMSNYSGFKSKNVNERASYGSDGQYVADIYSFNDKDHAVFEDGAYHKVGATFAINVGARYYFSEHWGIYGELGLMAVTVKSDTPKSWEWFTAGCTYKF